MAWFLVSSTLNGWWVWPALWALSGGPEAEKPLRKSFMGFSQKAWQTYKGLLQTVVGKLGRSNRATSPSSGHQSLLDITPSLHPKDSFHSSSKDFASQRKWGGTSCTFSYLHPPLWVLHYPVSSHIYAHF